ncbi:hypothetical protein D5S17_09750 [Pseudonocardiaceae bacterium YIM PH 21723]|nr:hypothetical protein D5S17_09750 [Pseudonocardiaceae bacterium YIM PH 21723]
MTTYLAGSTSADQQIDAAELCTRVDEVLDSVLTGKAEADVLRRFLATESDRPYATLCYWSWHGMGGRPANSADVLRVASGLELLRIFAALPEEPTAELCLVWSEELLRDCPLPLPISQVHALRSSLIADRLRHTTEAQRPEHSLEAALRGTRRRATELLLEQPILLGGQLAGADPALLGGLLDFSVPISEAYQLGRDLRALLDDRPPAHATVALALATERSAEPVPADIPDFLRSTGALRSVQFMMLRRIRHARRALIQAAIGEPALSGLLNVVSVSTGKGGGRG